METMERKKPRRCASCAERSIGQVARDFDLTETNVRTWVKPAEIDRGERPGLTTEERDELAKLRRENRFFRADRFSPPSNERSSTPARGPQDRDFDAISSSTSRVGTTPADCIRLSATSVPPNTKLPITTPTVRRHNQPKQPVRQSRSSLRSALTPMSCTAKDSVNRPT